MPDPERLRPRPFDLDVRRRPGAVTVTVRGDLDLAAEEPVRHAVGRLEELEALTMDLREVGFMDSTGLALLLGLHRSTAGLGVDLAVLPSAAVLGTLELVGLEDELPLAER